MDDMPPPLCPPVRFCSVLIPVCALTGPAVCSSVLPGLGRTGRLRTKVRVRAYVDEETRRQVAAARLIALEQDNYVSPAALEGQAGSENGGWDGAALQAG